LAEQEATPSTSDTTPAPAQAAAAAAPASSLADQYEFGEEADNKSVTPGTGAESGVPAVVDSPPANSSQQPRDAKGRFLPPTPEAPTAEPTPPSHPADLIDRALDYGIADEDIRAMDTAALRATVRAVEKQTRDLRASNQAWLERQQAIQGGQERAQSRQEGSQSSSASPAEDSAFQLETDGWDEGTRQLLQPLVDQINALHSALKTTNQTVAGVTGYVRQREGESMRQRLDRHFEKYQSHVGKGNYEDFEDNDPLLWRRRQILHLADQDKSNLPIEKKIDKVIRGLYGEAAAAPTSSAPSQREQDWQAAGLARPTQRNGRPETGKNVAVQNVASRLRDLAGQSTETGNADDNDFL
jgi:hypothetical protein